MSAAKREAMATVARAMAEKESAQTVLIGAILVVVHLLNIAPSELQAGGAKITLTDPIILRGALAAIFIHKLFSFSANSAFAGSLDGSIDFNREIARGRLRKYRKPGRSVQSAKLRARLRGFAMMALFLPYALCFALLLATAVVISIYDMVGFFAYCYEKTAVGLWIQHVSIF